MHLPISVIIPAHNRGAFLGRAIESAKAQVPAPAEIIVIDDGSTDDTAAVAAALGVVLIQNRISRGPGAARNLGIARAKSPWIAFLDSDDEWLPGHLHHLWNLQSSAKTPVSFVSDAAACFGNGRPDFLGYPGPGLRTYRGPSDAYMGGNSCMTSGVMVCAHALRECGGFGEQPMCEDLDTWIRVLTLGKGIASPFVGYRYRVHAGNMSGDSSASYAASKQVVESYRGEPWWDETHMRGLDMTWSWSPFRALGTRTAVRDIAFCLRHPKHLASLHTLVRMRRGYQRIAKNKTLSLYRPDLVHEEVEVASELSAS